MKKQLLSLALAIVMVFTFLPVPARAVQSGAWGDNITWTYDEGSKTLTVTGTGVIEDGAPWESFDIQRLVVEEGITEISYDAFAGYEALVSVTLPSTLTIIDSGAFEACEALEEIDVPASVTTISSNAFRDCTSLKKVTFHEGLETIGYRAFDGTALEEVTIPASVTGIGSAAFSCSTLQSITVEPGNQHYVTDDRGVLYTADWATLECCPAGVSGALYIDERCTYLTEFALDHADGITDLYIPAGTDIWPQGSADIYICMTLDGASNLQNIWFAEGHAEFISVDGLVMNAAYSYTDWDEEGNELEVLIPAGTKLCYVPYGRSGYFAVPEGVTGIWSFAMTSPKITALRLPRSLESFPWFYGGLDELSNLSHLMFTGEKLEGYIYKENLTVYYPGWLESWANPEMHPDWNEGYDYNITYIPYDQDNFPQLPGEPFTPFADVPEGQWYADPVRWAANRGITDGMGDGTFGVEADCNRAQVVTFLWRAAGCPEPTITTCEFTDVKLGKWYSKAVLWALETGVTNGMGDGTFGLTQPCNRATVVTFLHRAMNKPAPTSTECPFTDVPEKCFYRTAVLWAVENGITKGMGGTIFGSEEICNRAQVVTFLYRAFVK